MHRLLSKRLVGPELFTGLSDNFKEQLWSISVKKRMVKLHKGLILYCNLLKIIHVQLAVKRLEFLLMVVQRQKFRFKLGFVKDPKSWIITSPTNDFVGRLVLDQQIKSFDEF